MLSHDDLDLFCGVLEGMHIVELGQGAEKEGPEVMHALDILGQIALGFTLF